MHDDDAGRELFFVQSERDTLRLVKRNETERTGRDRIAIVGQSKVAAIRENDSVQVGERHLIKMVRARRMGISAMSDPRITPRDTWIEMTDEKITLTTGGAQIVMEGPNITVDADGGIRMTTDGKLIVEGKMVYFNVQSKQVDVQSDWEVKDDVRRPDRMIGSVRRLFYYPKRAETLERTDQGVTLAIRLPKACPIGPDYYTCRNQDFYDRHPGAPPPEAPDYYLNYGHKYYHRFHEYTEDNMTPEGLAWMDRTGVALQQAQEAKRLEDPYAFAQLELDNDAFRRFAYDTHPAAYVDSGLLGLSVQDLTTVGLTPDVGDLLTKDGLTQVWDVMKLMEGKDLWNMTKATGSEAWADTKWVVKTGYDKAAEGIQSAWNAIKFW